MILVVGGTGFIGKTLLLSMQEAGLEAFTVSRKPQRGFLAEHLPGVTSRPLDAFFRAPGKTLSQITGCVYLASSGRLGDNLETPWVEAQKMLAPLMRMLFLVFRNSSRKIPFVYLSSAAVYGRQDHLMLHEGLEPQPTTAYGTGKAMAEIAVAAAGRQAGCPTRVLRPSTPIGRWQSGGARGAVGALMDAAESGAPFHMNGDGSAVRDFFDARDLARAVIAALGGTGPGPSVWNVGAGTGTSLTELIAAVEDVTGRRIAIERRPMPPGEVPRAVLDIGRIRKDLGWTPQIGLHASLEDIWHARQSA